VVEPRAGQTISHRDNNSEIFDKPEQNEVEYFFDLLVLMIDSELEVNEIELANN